MLRSLKDLEQYAVSATDGDIGHVANFLLDDERWIVAIWSSKPVASSVAAGCSSRQFPFRQVDWLTRRFHLR